MLKRLFALFAFFTFALAFFVIVVILVVVFIFVILVIVFFIGLIFLVFFIGFIFLVFLFTFFFLADRRTGSSTLQSIFLVIRDQTTFFQVFQEVGHAADIGAVVSDVSTAKYRLGFNQ